MRERLGLPVFVDNDANAAALAEHRHGAARGARNAVVLTIGTGIGGGLIVDGEVYRGSTGAGAELGHVVVDDDGPPCQGNCPNHGCVETHGLRNGARPTGGACRCRAPIPTPLWASCSPPGEAIDGRAVTDAAQAGDEAARVVIERAGHHLGVALSSLANVFDPDVIVVGGGVTAGAGELLLEPARAELAARALTPQNQTPVVVAELGSDAGHDRGRDDGRRRSWRRADGRTPDRLPDADRKPRRPHRPRPAGPRPTPTWSPARTPAAPGCSTSGSS